MEGKQTAAWYLHIELQKLFPQQTYDMYNSNQYAYESLIVKVKAMDKEQMIDLWKGGQDSMEEGGKSFEQYYEETYGKE